MIAFDDFLKEITIDSSIQNIGQLYQKYRKKAEVVDLNKWFSEWDTAKKKEELENSANKDVSNENNIWESILVFSIEIEFPNNSGKGKRESFPINYVSSAFEAKIRESLHRSLMNNTFAYEDAMELEQSVLEGKYASSENQRREGIQQLLRGEIQSQTQSATGNDTNNSVTFKPLSLSENNKDSKLIRECTLNQQEIARVILEKYRKLIECFYKTDQDSNGCLTHFFLIANEEKIIEDPYTANTASDQSKRLRRNIKRDIIEWVREISFQVRNQHIKNLLEFANRETVRSAKAAIMSRNMSHNLGSHVMFYIKQKLQSVEKMFKDGALTELINMDGEKCVCVGDLSAKISQTIDKLNQPVDKSNEEKGSNIVGLEMPFLVGLGRFLNYLQERQDYIATIATDYIPYKSSINFKDAIYDELKPELRFKRHNTDKSIVGKVAANLLLEYIAYSEGITRSEQIELLFKNDMGDYFDGNGSSEDVPIKLRQLNIALPGGNFGRQAFFSIMENIIRNTAKHDGATISGGGRFQFKYDLIDFNEASELFAWTNSEIYQGDFGKVIEVYQTQSKNYYYLGITIDIEKPVDNDILEKIASGLKDGYIDDEGRMKEDFKGIKEIRISAAWMRGYGIDTDIPANEPPAVAISNNNGKLQYIICLPKPKKIAVIGILEKELDEQGVQFFSSNSIKDEEKKENVIRRIADFEMIVCSEKDKALIKSFVGSRVLTMDEKVKKDVWPIVNSDNLYLSWLDNVFGSQLPKLEINDEKSYENKHIKNINIDKDIDELLDRDLIDSGRVVCHSGDSSSNQIIYSKHYEGQESIRKTYNDAPFLEGVSGGNSTDRLIRQEKWTKEWYVKHMTAGMTKVAIFDERIHNSFVRFGKNTAFADWGKDRLKKWIEDLKNKYADKFNGDEIKYTFFKQKIKEQFKGLIDINDFVENVSLEARYTVIPDDDDILGSVINKLKNAIISVDYSIAALYEQKGILTFDISTVNGVVTIRGFSKKSKEDVDVATIKMKDDVLECSIINDDFSKKFDFVTIHQGILDKIYETLGIKGEDDRSVKMKKQVTKELFDKFSKLSSEEIMQDGFLPQFIIHSGRSRPTEKDMPQKQPFIQFAALDHAVRDCKYTLTELLYSAHYEQ